MLECLFRKFWYKYRKSISLKLLTLLPCAPLTRALLVINPLFFFKRALVFCNPVFLYNAFAKALSHHSTMPSRIPQRAAGWLTQGGKPKASPVSLAAAPDQGRHTVHYTPNSWPIFWTFQSLSQLLCPPHPHPCGLFWLPPASTACRGNFLRDLGQKLNIAVFVLSMKTKENKAWVLTQIVL